eukprot:TRINITY_DN2222_c0_g2_i1.p1 TRINITY_DN2222_c0_g2~~TRINITY_DN2222_c0_g2_i1.p1  ORF type:complete len:344 (+),score=49.00 TRINITY_DN2222_c0_g2_i1:67-1032(+)
MTDETLQFVRSLAGGLYISIASLCFLLCILSLLIQRKRRPTTIAFLLVTIVQSCIRAWLFLVDSSFYVKAMENEGLVYIIFLDLLPEAIFMFSYLQLLCVWIEVSTSTLRMKRFSHLRLFLFKSVAFFVLVVSCGIFLWVVSESVKPEDEHSWARYEDISDWEAWFITTWSAVVLSGILASTIVLIALVIGSGRRIAGNSAPHKRLAKQIAFLSVVCTIAFVFRAVYVHMLNAKFRKERANGEMSEKTFAWLFFVYFAVSEMLFQYILIVVFGYGIIKAVIVEVRKRIMRSKPSEMNVDNPLFMWKGKTPPTGDHPQESRV